MVHSDGRFKKNIVSNVAGLNFINKLNPVTYNYDIESLDEYTHGKKMDYSPQDLEAVKEKDGILYSGFIAQDVEKAANEVGYNFSGIHKPQNSHDAYGLDYSTFVVPLVKAVQELSVKSDSKDSIIAQQQQQLQNQQSQLDQLSAMVSKLDIALSECCSSYQSTTGSSQTGITNPNTNNTTPYLNQNFPNPFSQNTTISCYVPSTAQNASIIVYDLNGSALVTLNVPTTGYNQVVLAGGTLAAGDYLYTLYVNGQKIDSKKMTLTH
jgi:hypothetical protein